MRSGTYLVTHTLYRTLAQDKTCIHRHSGPLAKIVLEVMDRGGAGVRFSKPKD
ncbi:hypothetical protein [Ensifer sp. B1-9]|uniref:hypothetical protein n=1 Tax=Ensifer sp. B1-9 TaxID=3141455 RepID=UPI003D230422